MHKYITIAILVSYISILPAQQVFDIAVHSNLNESPISVLELDNYYIACSEKQFGDSENSNWFSSLKKIDRQGVMITDTVVYESSDLKILLLCETSEFTFFAAISEFVDENITNLILVSFDTDFNVLDTHKTQISAGRFSSANIFVNHANEYIMSGSYDINHLNSKIPYVFVIDENLNLTRQVYITGTNRSGTLVMNTVEKSDDSGYYMALWGGFLTYSLNEFLELDTNFQVSKSIIVESAVNHSSNIVATSDSTYCISGRFFYTSTGERNMAIVKYDTAHAEIMRKEFIIEDSQDVAGVYKNFFYSLTEPETLYFTGTVNPGDVLEFHYQSTPSWLAVYKLDTDLNVIWERFYGGDAFYFNTYSIPTSDGGILLCNTRYDFNGVPEYDAHFLKLDADGNLPAALEEQPEIKVSEQILYPNPGTSELTVRTAVQALGGIFTLRDISGKLILQQTINEQITTLNTTYLPAGTYLHTYTRESAQTQSGVWVKQ